VVAWNLQFGIWDLGFGSWDLEIFIPAVTFTFVSRHNNRKKISLYPILLSPAEAIKLQQVFYGNN